MPSVVRHHLCGFLVVLSLVPGSACRAGGQVQAPLTLDHAIASGLKYHPRVAASEASVEEARTSLLQAKVAQRPTLSAAEDFTSSNDPVYVFGSELRQGRFDSSDFALAALNHPAALANFSGSLTARWIIFDAGSSRRSVESTRSAVSAAELFGEYSSEELATQITKLYYRVLLAQDQIAVAEASAKRATELASDVSDRVRAGLSLESDGMRSALAQRTAEDDLTASHQLVTLARRDLFDAIGETDEGQGLARADVALQAQEEASAGRLEARADLRALREQETAARSDEASARAEAWPRLSTYAHVENDAEHVVTNGSGNWTVAAKLEIPLFDGGVRKAREQEAAAHLHALQAQERETAMGARALVAELQSQLTDLARRYATADDAVRVEREALQTAKDRFASGLASLSDVLTGEGDLSAAEFARVRIAYQLQTATAELALAQGTLSTSKAGNR